MCPRVPSARVSDGIVMKALIAPEDRGAMRGTPESLVDERDAVVNDITHLMKLCKYAESREDGGDGFAGMFHTEVLRLSAIRNRLEDAIFGKQSFN
jgi:hypothetical protein